MARISIRVPTTPVSTAALWLLSLLLSLRAADAYHIGPLRWGFYKDTCPRAEEIVRHAVAGRFMLDPTIPAGLIRLYFHDCFVRGCDASILLDETPSGEAVEKDSPANGKTLRGLDAIDHAKSRLEEECPGTVSCADILAFAARDAAVLAGLPSYRVRAGRRDGFVSLAKNTVDLPGPSSSVETLTEKFAKKGFKQSEMVVLSGAHSIGGAHCSSFDYRLYNFTTDAAQDPSLNLFHAVYLKSRCPAPDSILGGLRQNIKVDFDSISRLWLDASYYRGLMRGKGLLASDQALMADKKTRTLVQRMAKHPKKWAKKFAKAMIKVGDLDVLVGDEGEVRRSCRFIN